MANNKLVRIKNRYDTASNWASENPVLAAGEIGIDSTNNIIKVGNGSSNWKDLDVVCPKKNIYEKVIYDVSGGIYTSTGRFYLTSPLSDFSFASIELDVYDNGGDKYDFSTVFSNPIYKSKKTVIQNTCRHYSTTDECTNIYLYPYFVTDANISTDDLTYVKIGTEVNNEKYYIYLDKTEDSPLFGVINYYGCTINGEGGFYPEEYILANGLDISSLGEPIKRTLNSNIVVCARVVILD